MLRPGQLVQGRFRLDDVVGRGSASTVYRARDQRSGHDVAVKVAEWDIGTPERADTPVLPLRHPNIVGVHSITPLPVGRTSIAMELVQGGHLGAMLRHGPLKPDWARFVLEQSARALAHAHESGVVHGDIRPENIVLLQPQVGREQVKLAGFDGALVSKLASPGRGPNLGASAFAAPEQRHTGRASAASDIYSLASTVWFATTGLSHKDDGAHQMAAAIPEDLRLILWRCLSPLPGDRYVNGHALLAALTQDHSLATTVGATLVPTDRPPRGVGTPLGIIMVSAVTLAAMSVVTVGLLVGQQVSSNPTFMTLDPGTTPIIGVDSGVSGGGIVATAPPEPTAPLAPVAGAPVDVAPSPSLQLPVGPSLGGPAVLPTEPAVAETSAEPILEPVTERGAHGRAPSLDPAPAPPVTRPAPPVTRSAPVVAPAAARPAPRAPAVVAPAPELVAQPAPAQPAPRVVAEPAPADPSAAKAPTTSTTTATDAPFRAMLGVHNWTGQVDGKTERLSLSVSPDGTVYGTIRGEGLARSYARGVFGSAELRDGKVHIDILETRRIRPRAFEGVISPAGGSGTVSIRGRERGGWSLTAAAAGERDTGATTD